MQSVCRPPGPLRSAATSSLARSGNTRSQLLKHGGFPLLWSRGPIPQRPTQADPPRHDRISPLILPIIPILPIIQEKLNIHQQSRVFGDGGIEYFRKVDAFRPVDRLLPDERAMDRPRNPPSPPFRRGRGGHVPKETARPVGEVGRRENRQSSGLVLLRRSSRTPYGNTYPGENCGKVGVCDS